MTNSRSDPRGGGTRGFGTEPPDRRLDYATLSSRLRGVLNGLGNIYRVPMADVCGRPGLACGLK